MRVLIASDFLADPGGVQTYERDLACWLLERGHSPVVYSPVLGESARQLERLTVPVTDNLSSIAAVPDLIHGDGPVATMTALLHFRRTPAMFVCHGWQLNPAAPRFPRILRYVAVDDTCADRLLTRDGIPPERVSVLLNAVDIRRFRQRAPLPAKPGRAIVFSNAAHELTHLPIVREACRQASIDLDVVGQFANTSVSDPESLLGRYDLAFAKAKCAIEAMACGLAVVLCDSAGIGGMVRTADVDRMRRLNFGKRALNKPPSVESLLDAIALYDPADARKVSDHIRATATMDELCNSLYTVYETVIEEYARQGGETDYDAEGRLAAAFLHRLALANAEKSNRVVDVTKAAQRALTMPVVGPAMRKAVKWLIRRKR
jgi:hypothetical protein